METFDQCSARIKAEVRRDEIDERKPKPVLRYCWPCDRWMRTMVCVRCGMDTERS